MLLSLLAALAVAFKSKQSSPEAPDRGSRLATGGATPKPQPKLSLCTVVMDLHVDKYSLVSH